MKAIYEYFHEHGREKLEKLTVGKNRHYSYFAHFHSNIEVFLVGDGSFPMTLNGKTYIVGADDIFFIDHYDIHEYCPDYTSRDNDRCLIIPERFLISFNKARQNKKILSPVIHNPELCQKLITLIDDYIAPNKNDEQILARAVSLFMFMILKELKLSNTNTNSAKDDVDLIKNILSYIYNNYKSDISLVSISKQLGYTSEHISRVFHKYFNYGIRDHINELRIEHIKANEEYSNTNITELIFDAGFKNTSTYYRQLAKYNKKKTHSFRS